MVGETANFGGNNGNVEQSAENARAVEGISKAAVDDVAKMLDRIRHLDPSQAMDYLEKSNFYKDNNITDANKQLAFAMQALHDSKAIGALVKAIGAADEAEAARAKAEAEARAKAEAEAKQILGEQEPKEFLENYRSDIEKISGEIERERTGNDLATSEAREYAQRRIVDAKRTMASMIDKYEVVQKAYPEAGEPIPDAYKKETEAEVETEEPQPEGAPGAAEIDLNEVDTSNLSVDDAIAVLVAHGLSDADARALLEKMPKPEGEKNPEDGYAQSDEAAGEPTPEEIADAARAAARPYHPTAITKKAEPVKQTNRPKTAEEMRRERQEVVDEYAKMKPGRFDKNDYELHEMQRQEAFAKEREARELAEKKERIANIKEKIKGRLPGKNFFAKLKRKFMTTALVAFMGVMLTPTVTQAASNLDAGISYEATDADDGAGEDVTSTAEQSIEEQLETDLGITIEDFENVVESGVGFTEAEARARGEELFAGFMDREGSEIEANGLRSNFGIFHQEGKERKNSWSIGFEDKCIDENGNVRPGANETVAREAIKVLRDEPQALASFTAAFPGVLELCGVDESVIAEQNVENRAKMLMEMMLGDGGGDLQNRLLGGIDLALRDESTTYDFYRNYELGRSFYFKQVNPDAGVAGYQIGTSEIKRDGAWYTTITITYADGKAKGENRGIKEDAALPTYESAAAHLGCGIQIELNANYELVLPDKESAIVYTVTSDDVFVIVNGETPEDESPGENPPDGETLEGEDEVPPTPPTPPSEGTPPAEVIQEKNLQNLLNTVNNGIQTQITDQRSEGGYTDESGTYVSDENSAAMIGGQEGGLGKSDAEIADANALQDAANNAEQNVQNMTNEDLVDYMNALANGLSDVVGGGDQNYEYVYQGDADQGDGGGESGDDGQGGGDQDAGSEDQGTSEGDTTTIDTNAA